MQAVEPVKVKPSRAGQYLTFEIAGEEYAVSILKVKEIIEYRTVTVVPNTPAWIRGVTNLRGDVVPVVDLAVKFGWSAGKITKFSCVLIAEVLSEGEMLTLGVLADSVSQVLDFSKDDIEDPPPFGARVNIEYLLGMGCMDKKFCLILDIDKVLSTDELLAAAESTEPRDTAEQNQHTEAQSSSSGA